MAANITDSSLSTWSWFEGDKPKTHELQTVLDTLAYSENIDVRLLNWQALDELDVGALLSDEIKEQLKPSEYAKELASFCSDIFFEKDNASNSLIHFTKTTPYQWMSDQARKVWLTLPSNPLPIYSLFRMNKEWCWFNLAWFYSQRHLIKERADQGQPLKAFGIDGWEFHFRWVTLPPQPQKRYLLVFGPSYKTTCSREPGDFSGKEGKNIIDCFRRFYDIACSKSQTGLGDEELMQRMLLARLPLPKDEINWRIKKVLEAFEAMTASLTPTSPYCYRFSDFTILAKAYICAFRSAAELKQLAESSRKTSLKDVSKSLQLYFPLLSWNGPDNIERNASPIFFRLDIDISSIQNGVDLVCKQGIWPLIQAQPIPDKNGFYLAAIGEDNFYWDHQDTANLNLRISRWEERATIRQRFSQNLCADMLHNWLQDHLGELLEDSPDAKKLYAHICGTIADNLRGDLCHLYRYKHHDDSVVLYGGAYRNENYTYNKEALSKQMEKLSQEQKNRSAVYRCIADDKPTIYETARTNGKDNFLCDGLPDTIKTQSALISPISHMGRIYGVIEVSSHTPYQFSQAHLYALSNIESILGAYLYRQQLLFSLKKITRLALDKRQKNSPKELSRVLSEIFLCKEVSILLANKTHEGAFTLYGSTQPEFFKDHKKDLHGGLLVRGNTECCLQSLKEQYAGGEPYVITDNPKSNEPFANELIKAGLPCTMTFALTRNEPTHKVSRKQEGLVGAVMLHHHLPWKNVKKWQAIMYVINGQLMVALDLLDALYDEQQNNIFLVNHEISLGCKALLDIQDKASVSLNTLQNWCNARQKQIREIKTAKNPTHWMQFYRQLVDSFYGEKGYFLPEMHILNQRMENMGHRAKLLKGTIEISELLRQEDEGMDIALLFGGTPDLESMEEALDLRTLVGDIYETKRSDFPPGVWSDFGGLPSGFMLKDVYPQMIGHWITNLVDNASKYITSNYYSVQVEPRIGNHYRLIFENHGLPLTLEESQSLPSFFEPGTRASGTRDNQQGDGLGLYATRLICKYLNIEHELQYQRINESDAIFRFIFTIPASRVELSTSARNFLTRRRNEL